MILYTLEILVTLIKGPGHENWIQPKESVTSEALCYKMYPWMLRPKQARWWLSAQICSVGCVSAADAGIGQRVNSGYLNSCTLRTTLESRLQEI